MARHRLRLVIAVTASLLVTTVAMPLSNASAGVPAFVDNPASLVDPIVGTSGSVDDFPGADVPFGMVQWSPDTPSRPAGGGYEYNDKSVTGFSLTHVSGPGCAASGDIPILPTTGPIGANPGVATLPLDHAAEQAVAGHYQLAADGITTELSATQRTGSARFTFPLSAKSNLILKLSDSAAGSSATSFQVVGPQEITGSVTSGKFCGANDSYTVYFDMRFDQPVTGYGTYTNQSVQAGNRQSQITRNIAPSRKQPEAQQPESSNGQRRSHPDVTGKTPAKATTGKTAAASPSALAPPRGRK